MNYYINVKFFENADYAQYILISRFFELLHKNLVLHPNLVIGVSFPEYNMSLKSLGNTVRLHGCKADIEMLLKQDWLAGLCDFINFEEVCPVPLDHKHCTVRRIQVKSNAERVRRRQMHRHHLTEAEVREKIPDSIEKKLDFPFVHIKSSSTNQVFPLFINQSIVETSQIDKKFNAYGFSQTSTLPFF